MFFLFYCFFFFFFFQAEDGIRDRNVTGVQTCALPILCFVKRRFGPGIIKLSISSGADFSSENSELDLGRWLCGFRIELRHLRMAGRSEERRVGKECRSRWSQYH